MCLHYDFSDTRDFTPTTFNLVIPAGELRACMNIVAIDDKIALEEDLVADATVTIINPDIGSPSFPATVTLVDNDGEPIAPGHPNYNFSTPLE